MRTKTLSLIGLMTAVTCMISPFIIPLPTSPVPLTLGTFALYLSLFILGMKKALVSCLLYLLLGFVGLPVFSGFSGGAGKLLGPTGGYLVGYIFLCIVAGFFIDKWVSKWYLVLCGLLLGTVFCYLFGTLWLAYLMKLSFSKALFLGVIPYIPLDLLKMALALLLGIPLRKALIKAHLV